MTRILFRCDASLAIGSGHVMRCRTLARELSQRGAEIILICRNQPGDLISVLKREFTVIGLSHQKHPTFKSEQQQSLEGRDLYANWLGCTQQLDAIQTLAGLKQSGIDSCDWLVVDHYGLDASWHQTVIEGLTTTLSTRPRLLSIDDLADRPHQADILLDQNFFGEATQNRYTNLVPKHCRQLLGPHFALLGPEYAKLHPLVPTRTTLQRVLVFFGGVDPNNLTATALAALMTPELSHLAVDVVLGTQSPHLAAVKTLMAEFDKASLHTSLPTLAGLIARADFAIGAGGTTTWERACLGLPSLVVPIAANQIPIAQGLKEHGHIQLLQTNSEIKAEQIKQALLQILQKKEPLASGQELTDGYGSQRLATAMLGCSKTIHLRPLQTNDQPLLKRWNNYQSELISKNLTESIKPKKHKVPLTAEPNSERRLHWIVMDGNGCPLGQVHLDRSINNHTASIDISLDPTASNLEITEQIFRKTLKKIECTWGSDVIFLSEKRNSNLPKTNPIEKVSHKHSKLSPPSLGPSRVTLLSDKGSWLNEHLIGLIQALLHRGHSLRWIHDPNQLAKADICLLLSCGHLLNPDQLKLHRHNLVVHESALPAGQGWSPMTWQILEGANEIPITLFEATSEIDAGPIYLQEVINLNGTELIDQWRKLQQKATIKLCLQWFDCYSTVIQGAMAQQGESTYYPRRSSIDSALDPALSIEDQFNLLRVTDHRRYPAFFDLAGMRYQLQIKYLKIPPVSK